MIKGRYRVMTAFTVFRQSDKAPKHLTAGLYVAANEPLEDPVILEFGSERYTSELSEFMAHTLRSRDERAGDTRA